MSSAADTSDDFFSSFDGSPPKKQVAMQPANKKVTASSKPARRAPPPPPRPAAAAAVAGNNTATTATTAAASALPAASYYGAGTAKQPPSGGPPKQQQRARAAAGAAANATAAAATSTSSSSASYYGTNNSTMRVQSTRNSGTAAGTHLQTGGTTAAATAPSYYGAPAPFAPPVTAAPAPAAAGPASTSTTPQTSATDSDWYTPDASTTAQPQQQSSMLSNPYAAQAAPTGTTTFNPQNFRSSLMQSSSSLEGEITGQQQQQQQPPQPTLFVPTAPSPASGGVDMDDFANEPPLLEELGINLEHILWKTKAVVVPFKRLTFDRKTGVSGGGFAVDPALIVDDSDLAGPLAFALLLGGEMLLSGKLNFGYIYGFGMFGCLSMTLILNLMTPNREGISVWTVTSILGYALLPVNVLAAVKILLINIARLHTLGRILSVITVFWSTMASTRLLEIGCGMQDQRYLMAYPIALLYSAFVLITIF